MTYLLLAVFLAIVTFLNIIVPAFGSTTVTPIMAGFVGTKDAIAVATVFYCIVNIPRVYLFRKYTDWKLVKQLLPASLIGAFLGSIFLVGINTLIISFIILGFLLYFIYKKIAAISGRARKEEKKPTRHGATFNSISTGRRPGLGCSTLHSPAACVWCPAT